MWKRILMLVLAVIPFGTVAAEPWPSRPINLVVPFAAGGPTDQLARFVAAQIEKALGKPVVVMNATGAGGVIGMEKLARADSDGYTLGLSAYSMVSIAPHLSKLPYDTVKSFTPVGPLAAFPYVLTVGGKSPLTSLKDLIDKAKAAPGTVAAASAGVGTGTHLAIALLSQETGAEFNDVQYKGSGPIVPALIGGHVDFTFEVIGSAVSVIKSGATKALAISGSKRHPLLMDVPTVAETYPGFDVMGWYAIFGPAGLPPEITGKLNEALRKAQETDEFNTYLQNHGYDSMIMTSAQLSDQIQKDLLKWSEVIKAIPKVALEK